MNSVDSTPSNSKNTHLDPKSSDTKAKKQHFGLLPDSLIESISDGFLSLNRKGHIISLNQTAKNILGCTAKEVIGKSVSEIIVGTLEDTQTSLATFFRTLINQAEEERNLSSIPVILKNGKRIGKRIFLTCAPLLSEDAEITGYSILIKKGSKEAIDERINDLRIRLFEYASHHSLELVLTKTLDEIELHTGSTVSFYHFLEEDQETLSLQAWSTRTKTTYCKAIGAGLHYQINEAGVWVDCVRQRKTVIHNDYSSLPHKKGLPEGHSPVIREMVVPVFRDQLIVAILGVGNKPTEYTPEDATLTEYLADVCWEIAQQKKTEQELIDKSKDLTERVKELKGLYSIMQTLASISSSFEEKILAITHILAKSFTHIQHSIVQITYLDTTYSNRPKDPIETPCIKTQFGINEQDLGTICVGYDAQLTSQPDPLFLPEEQELIEGVSNQISQFLEKQFYLDSLEKSKRTLSQTLNSIGEAVISIDLEGRVLQMNPIAEQITQCSLPKCALKSLYDFAHFEEEDSGRGFKELISSLDGSFSKKEVLGKLFLKNPTQHFIYIQLTLSPLIEDEQLIKGFVLIFRDISTQRETELELERSYSKYKNLFNSIQDSIILTDQNRIISETNTSFSEIFGYTQEEVVGKSISLIYDSLEDFIQVGESLKHQSPHGEYSFKIRFRKKNGKLFVGELNIFHFKTSTGVTGGLIGSVRDITEKETVAKQLEQALIRNQALLNANPDLLFVFDNNMHIVDFSATQSKSELYVSPEEFLHKDLANFLPPHLVHTSKKAIRFVLKEKQPKVLTYEMLINGELKTYESRYVPCGKSEVLSIVRDITEQRKNEEALIASEKKFKDLFHEHAAIKLIIDPSTGAILDANKSACSYYGWDIYQLTNMSIHDINTLSEKEVQEEIIRAKKNKASYFEFRHKRADGSIRDVEVFTSFVTIDQQEVLHSIVHDITDKKKVEKKLTLLSRSVEQNPVSIVITDKDGLIEYVNPSFTQNTGYTLEEVAGKNPRILKSGYQSRLFYKKLWDTILSGKDWKGELKNKRKDGGTIWEEAIISPIINQKGILTHFVAVKEDITERKKMIDELIKAKEQAEESDRLKTAFLANMSHEIRTPMNGILGFAELLKENSLDTTTRQEYLDIIKQSGYRMMDTLNDLIDISKIESGSIKVHFSQVNLIKVLSDLVLFFKPQIQNERLDFEWINSISEKDYNILTDVRKLESIITNLLKNAIKYTNQGTITLHSYVENDTVVIAVSDTGIGIDQKDLSQIFYRFHQLHPSQKGQAQGVGLGLAISKAYAKLLNGNISVDSKVNKGSIFTFTFPLKSSERDQQKPAKIASKIVHQNSNERLTVLIAEDEPLIAMYLKTVFESIQAHIYIADRGDKAVELVKKHPEIDLILMDLSMPGLDGFEATKQIRSFNSSVLIIAQTAYAFAEIQKKVHEVGCDDYISKPIMKDVLLKKVSVLIKKKSEFN